MRIIRKLKAAGFDIINHQIPFQCTVFEDKSRAIKIAKANKYQPHSKHINNKLRHFHSYMTKGRIKVKKISTGINQQTC